ncbi:hypothetical protein LptCag_0201 [Leptospirillum ferriphilum]|uniref:Uncharacterized protein n=1 Tax=Leptospirillum ferriphilum TaxID=178606 RepID=A0A094W7X8_9BACT|nr:hypothetical protein LptCag_0201 [Leptospirillum ferriphilum]
MFKKDFSCQKQRSSSIFFLSASDPARLPGGTSLDIFWQNLFPGTKI